MFFGTSREKLLDRADPSLSLSPLVTQFGHYIKIIVKEEDEDVEEPVRSVNESRRSMLDVMRQAQAKLPASITERNSKDKLFNALVGFLKSQGLSWAA